MAGQALWRGPHIGFMTTHRSSSPVPSEPASSAPASHTKRALVTLVVIVALVLGGVGMAAGQGLDSEAELLPESTEQVELDPFFDAKESE